MNASYHRRSISDEMEILLEPNLSGQCSIAQNWRSYDTNNTLAYAVSTGIEVIPPKEKQKNNVNTANICTCRAILLRIAS